MDRAKWSSSEPEWHFQNVKSSKITNQEFLLTQGSIPLIPWTLEPIARFRLLASSAAMHRPHEDGAGEPDVNPAPGGINSRLLLPELSPRGTSRCLGF